MGVRKDDLTQYIQQLETLKADIPAITGWPGGTKAQ